METQNMAGVLNGIRILDLTRGISGPMATMLLVDHGADVNALVRHGTPGRRFSADFSLRSQYIGTNAFWLAAKFADNIDIMRALADAGADRALDRARRRPDRQPDRVQRQRRHRHAAAPAATSTQTRPVSAYGQSGREFETVTASTITSPPPEFSDPRPIAVNSSRCVPGGSPEAIAIRASGSGEAEYRSITACPRWFFGTRSGSESFSSIRTRTRPISGPR